MARYELLDRIGVGGMAEVFRGRALAGGGFVKPVAIKRILPNLSQDQRFVALLMKEAQMLSQLRHRNIVQIFDVGLGDDGQYFLVMEFVDGPDLSGLFEAVATRGNRIPLELSLYICAEVCDALEQAHRARDKDGKLLNLVHRDVSPSNVLMSRSGMVKLSDFGIAKTIEEMTGHGSVRGKFAYISPEQARNEHVDARSDVFSVGIVLAELAAGRAVLSHLPDYEALAAVRDDKIPRLRRLDPNLPDGLAAIVDKALSFDAADRFESAAALGTELRTYRYSLATSAGPAAKELAALIKQVLPPPPIDVPVAKEPTRFNIQSARGLRVVWEDEDDDDDEEFTVLDHDPYRAARSNLDSFVKPKPADVQDLIDSPTALAEVPAELDSASGKTRSIKPAGKRQEPLPALPKPRIKPVPPQRLGKSPASQPADSLIDSPVDPDAATMLREFPVGSEDEFKATVPRLPPVGPKDDADAVMRERNRKLDRDRDRERVPAEGPMARPRASLAPRSMPGLSPRTPEAKLWGLPRNTVLILIAAGVAILLIIAIAAGSGGGSSDAGGSDDPSAVDAGN